MRTRHHETRALSRVTLVLCACASDNHMQKVEPGAGHDSAIMDTAPPLVTAWYADADGDGYGDPDVEVDAEQAPEGYVADSNDCDDTDALLVFVCPELGNASDGTVEMPDGFDLNRDVTGTRTEPDGVAWRVVGDVKGTMLTAESADGIAEGDVVLVAAIGGNGAWEVRTVAAVDGATLTFTDALTLEFRGSTIVQRVPQYDDLTVDGTVTASAWDDLATLPRATGIIAFKVRHVLTGSISADALGYAGACGGAPHGPLGEIADGGGTGTDGGWADGGAGAGTAGSASGADGSPSCGNAGGVGGLGGGGGGGKITWCAGGDPSGYGGGGGAGGGGAAYLGAPNGSSDDAQTLLHGGGGSAGAAGGASGANAGSGETVAPGGGPVGPHCASPGGGTVLVWSRTANVAAIDVDGEKGSSGSAGESQDATLRDDGGGGGGGGGQGAAGGTVRLDCIECTLASVSARGGHGGDGGDGGDGYGRGGTGGRGAPWGATPESGTMGTYSGDGGAPGGGGAGGEAGAGGVIWSGFTYVNGQRVGSDDAAAALEKVATARVVTGTPFGP